MNIIPIGDRLLVSVKKAEEQTEAGLEIVHEIEQDKSEGTVLSIGSGDIIVKLGIKEGDTVVFSKYSGDEIVVEGKKYRVLTSEEILVVIK
jgi:chaperonin GroES